ncbi:alpha/beta-hydrolase [Colletotrichum somersetense]|nr:alpha/beta-hydrolase [Colletotrichum somersetense]
MDTDIAKLVLTDGSQKSPFLIELPGPCTPQSAKCHHGSQDPDEHGSDTSSLGSPVSEDCLTINIVRPAGTKPGDDLPVGLWIHGGSYVNGGSRDPRYNLSYIVDQSVKKDKPMIAASTNYRLSFWGFLFSRELQDNKAGNIGFKDQQSAGARSIGLQLIAYDGKHDNLFRGAVLQSGSPVARFVNADAWQPYFEALLRKTECAKNDSAARISCLQALPWQTLNGIFNGSDPLGVTAPGISAVVDGDFITAQASTLLRQGKFAPCINTTEEFKAWLASSLQVNTTQIAAISELYLDDPNVGIPTSYPGRPSGDLARFGSQWKRVAAVAGDYQQNSGRRHLARSYAGIGLPVYSYMWDIYVNGIAPIYGATHFQEVAFAFNKVQGLGYAINPFEGKPQSYVELAGLMSSMWVTFIHSNDGNGCDAQKMNGITWPRYTPGQPHNLVFNANYTTLSYFAQDKYREAQISYLQESAF